MCWIYFGSRRDITKTTGGKTCTEFNLSQYFKLWAAHLWEVGCVFVLFCFFLNFFLSEILSPEEQAMSPLYGLQLLSYLANFKIPTKNKYFAMSQ